MVEKLKELISEMLAELYEHDCENADDYRIKFLKIIGNTDILDIENELNL